MTALTLALWAGAASAAAPLSGFWQMDGVAKPPTPALTKWAKDKIAKVNRDGDIDVEARRWCVVQGMPHVMDSAGPIDIIQGSREITILAESLAFPRHVYVDRKKHPGRDVFDDIANGNSLGSWDKGVLVVDTVGFNDGVGPFGAPRTPSTHLVERFQVVGDTLKLSSTWTDPKVYAKPFTYTLTYKRLPADYTAQESYCDPHANGVGHD